jgi:hypothetical protein
LACVVALRRAVKVWLNVTNKETIEKEHSWPSRAAAAREHGLFFSLFRARLDGNI